MSETGSGPPMSSEGMSLADMLKHHEARSQERYKSIMDCVEEKFDNLHDHVAEHGHDEDDMSKDSGLGLAALAALSQKGVGNDMSPLALTAMMHRGGNDRMHDGWGHGGLAGAALGFVAGALVNGGRRGGLFGGGDEGGDGCERPVFDAAILGKLGTLEGLVPTTALQTQLSTQQAVSSASLNELQAISNAKDTTQAVGAALGSAVSGVKDSVQNLALFLSNQLNVVNQNVSEQGCQTRSAVQLSTQAILERINANTIAELQAELAEARHHGRGKESEISISQTVTQVQAQAQQQQQQQQQFAALNGILCQLHGLTQIAHATNANIVAGNSGPVLTGAQTANPTNIGGIGG
jgi:hypothetical protein